MSLSPMSLLLLDAMTNVRFNDDAHAEVWRTYVPRYVGEEVKVRQMQVYQLYY
jgi:hypothetical protein